MIFQNSPDITSREAVNFEISLTVFIPNTPEAMLFPIKIAGLLYDNIRYFFPLSWKLESLCLIFIFPENDWRQ